MSYELPPAPPMVVDETTKTNLLTQLQALEEEVLAGQISRLVVISQGPQGQLTRFTTTNIVEAIGMLRVAEQSLVMQTLMGGAPPMYSAPPARDPGT